MRTPTLKLRTPEGVVFSRSLAGPVTRFLAWCIDLACIVVLLTALSYLAIVFMVLGAGVAGALITLGYFVVSIGYGLGCEWFLRGQTVGKRFLRLRVVDAEGMRLRFDQVVTRNLLRAVDSLPLLYLVGGVAVWLSPRCQRLGDLAANTVVIRTPIISEPDIDQLTAGKFNSLRDYPHLAGRLRQLISPEEAAIAAQALLRRADLDAEARLQLFQELAGHFRTKVAFPPEATEGIPDEQYVRNVVDLVYRPNLASHPA